VFDHHFSTKYQQTGIGMSFVLQVVNEHNGIIDINSSVDEGTIITLKLPKLPT